MLYEVITPDGFRALTCALSILSLISLPSLSTRGRLGTGLGGVTELGGGVRSPSARPARSRGRSCHSRSR